MTDRSCGFFDLSVNQIPVVPVSSAGHVIYFTGPTTEQAGPLLSMYTVGHGCTRCCVLLLCGQEEVSPAVHQVTAHVEIVSSPVGPLNS